MNRKLRETEPRVGMNRDREYRNRLKKEMRCRLESSMHFLIMRIKSKYDDFSILMKIKSINIIMFMVHSYSLLVITLRLPLAIRSATPSPSFYIWFIKSS